MSSKRRSAARAPLPEGFGAIWTCVAIDLIGFGILLPILPLYAERYGASPAKVGLLVATFSMAQFLFSPVLGRVSDRIGRRPVLILSLLGTAVGSLLTGLAWSLPLLFVGRIVDGTSGASVSVAQAAVIDVAPVEQRARLLGLLGAAFGVGFVAGPAIGALAALGGSHLPFYIAAVIAGVNAIVAYRRLPETRSSVTGSLQVAPPRAQPFVALPLMNVHLLVEVGRLVLVAFLALVAFSAFEATFALFGERRLGFGIASAGLVFTVIGLIITIVQVGLVHPAVERFGEQGALRVGLLVNGVGLVVLTAVHSWIVLAIAIVALCTGQGLVTPNVAAVLAGRVGASRRGEVLGIQQSAGSLARVVGPLAGGFAFGHLGPGVLYAGAAGVMVVAAGVLH